MCLWMVILLVTSSRDKVEIASISLHPSVTKQSLIFKRKKHWWMNEIICVTYSFDGQVTDHGTPRDGNIRVGKYCPVVRSFLAQFLCQALQSVFFSSVIQFSGVALDWIRELELAALEACLIK